ncbi:MAG: hypothetical protein AB7V42_11050 [Thermoleophilia bacterium]
MKRDRVQEKRTLKALRNVQRAARELQPGPPADGWVGSRVLHDVSGGGHVQVFLTRDLAAALRDAANELLADLRYEWIREPDDAAWLLASRSYLDRRTDQIAGWEGGHCRAPEVTNCYLPVERLNVAHELSVLGYTLLPLEHPQVPRRLRRYRPRQGTVSVLAIEVCGTSPARMAQRAQATGRRVLRALRFALREHRSVADEQLLFRLGIAYAFNDEGLEGWKRRRDDGFELGFGAVLRDFVAETAMDDLAATPTNDLSRRFDTALWWLERSSFSTEEVVSLLYSFFALEAILGDQSEKLKAHALAFRQAMLSIEDDDSFRHPDETWWYYDQVRSAAVHGEVPPDLSWKQVEAFRWTVRHTLLEARRLCRAKGFRRRVELTRWLDGHPERDAFEGWLRERAGGHWAAWIDREPPAE